jgi:hypothetical protein
LLVAGPDVGDTQVEEGVHSVEIRRRFKEDLWLVGRRATTGIKNDPTVSQLDVAGIFRFDHFAAKNSDVEVLRFFLIPHGEEVRNEEAFVCNRCIRQIHSVPPVNKKDAAGIASGPGEAAESGDLCRWTTINYPWLLLRHGRGQNRWSDCHHWNCSLLNAKERILELPEMP